MKICLVCPTAMNAVAGGVKTQVEQTASFLEKNGIAITRYTPWETYDWGSFDLVHLFKADFDNVACAQWLEHSNIPYVVSSVFFNARPPLFSRIHCTAIGLGQKVFGGITSNLSCVQQICSKSSGILPNTQSEADYLCRGMGLSRKKMFVVPNGVETHFHHGDPDLFVKKHKTKDFILSVGNFGYERKNMLRLLQAMEQIDHPCVVIGTMYANHYGLACQKIIKRARNILWIDAIPHNDPMLASAYAACRVFALPSLFETPGIAAMEAALTGATIVLTPYGGTKEYFMDMAHYPEPSSSASIKMSLISALQQQRSDRLQQHILKNFTWQHVAEKTISAYKKACDQQ